MSHSYIPLVSVVTPILPHTEVRLFVRSVESVRRQEYKRIEHIIINGGPAGDDRKRLSSYLPKGQENRYSENVRGIYEAMNAGLHLARGKYIAFLPPGAYWHHAQGVALSVHQLEQEDGDYSCAPHEEEGENGYRECTPMLGHFFCRPPFALPTMLCRTELLRSRGGFNDSRFKVCADYDFMLELILGGWRGVGVPLCFTRISRGGWNGGNTECADKERRRLFQRYFSPVIGMEAADKLNETNIPLPLLQALCSLVERNVRKALLQEYYPAATPGATDPLPL